MRDNIIFKKADELSHLVYALSKNFPKEELFGITSQIRRAALSVVLNIVEGFARQSRNENRRFLEISYASLKEVKYLLYFTHSENLLDQRSHDHAMEITEEIGKMLWSAIKTLRNNN